jgi:hypothetical protein
MTDIVERLDGMTRSGWRYLDRREDDGYHCAITDASDEITTLRSSLNEIREENDRLKGELDRRTANPADYRYWEGRYRDEKADNERLRVKSDLADHYEEILRTVCGHLELPQSESGPADDLTLYDRALESEDVMYRKTEAERVEHMNARYRAEAKCEAMAKALEQIRRHGTVAGMPPQDQAERLQEIARAALDAYRRENGQ